ncbi:MULTISPECIES: ABC transporter permease [unclassified Streptomyces]|uniref:ABC transporter permease n=1 Tax=unclassified Streptomyces TaxID=2593676 RepID=UPI0023656F08|nr:MULTISPECIES: ABC transporter permease [unclassified Streptomyces]MDF3147280.1 ABC transporter permease [Streptomyces sp. T21Q-yed]WDF38130.1 ABC transporter permease [Streptomyces sp. T12]
MGRLVEASGAVRQGAVVATEDFRAFYTWRTWLGGWLVRLLCQVLFFSQLATLVGDPGYVVHVVVGASLLVGVLQAMQGASTMVRDILLGTLPLLAASPVEPGCFFLGRSLCWPLSGVVSSSIALLTLSPLFGASWTLTQVPLLVLLVLLTTLATYCVALVLGAVALVVPMANNLLSALGTMATTVLCGAITPVHFWPGPVQAVAQTIPATHGLSALLLLEADAGFGPAAYAAGRAALAGVCWLALGLVCYRLLFRHARRGGSLFS